jgi:hypothetical protein
MGSAVSVVSVVGSAVSDVSVVMTGPGVSQHYTDGTDRTGNLCE